MNKQLVATEEQLKESRIVADLSKVLSPGYADISIMGAAYPGTSLDFYVVAKDSVLTAIQGKPLGKVLYFIGPIKIIAKQEEEFSNSFDLSPDEAKSRLQLSLRLFSKNLAKERLYLNGQLLATEKDFSAEGQTILDVTGKTTEGSNKIVVRGDAEPGSSAAWMLMQMPLQREETRGGMNSPVISSLNPADEAIADQTIEIAGRNFDTDPGNVRVMLDEQELPVQLCSKDKLTIHVPNNIKSGEYRISVEVGEELSAAVPLKIAGLPHVSSASVSQCPPDYEFIVYGDNFPESAEKVKVTIGGLPAELIASSKNSLLVKMPKQDHSESRKEGNDLAVKVSVGKLESKDSVFVKLASNAVRSAKSGAPLLMVSSAKNSRAFDEKLWRSCVDKASASMKENHYESAEFYLNQAVDQASRDQIVSHYLTDSLRDLAACYSKQNLLEEAQQCDEVIQALSTANNLNR